MKLAEYLSDGIYDKFVSGRFVSHWATIFTITVLGVLSVELFCDKFLPGYEISGMHIITVLFSGLSPPSPRRWCSTRSGPCT